MATKQPVQIADIVNEPHYFDVPSGYSAVLLLSSLVPGQACRPMSTANELIGAIVIYRIEVRPFQRQADRAGQELRCASRHRHRERAPVQRVE